MKGSHQNTNYYLAAILCRIKNVNGWINLQDSNEIFIKNPNKFLRLDMKHNITQINEMSKNKIILNLPHGISHISISNNTYKIFTKEEKNSKEINIMDNILREENNRYIYGSQIDETNMSTDQIIKIYPKGPGGNYYCFNKDELKKYMYDKLYKIDKYILKQILEDDLFAHNSICLFSIDGANTICKKIESLPNIFNQTYIESKNKTFYEALVDIYLDIASTTKKIFERKRLINTEFIMKKTGSKQLWNKSLTNYRKLVNDNNLNDNVEFYKIKLNPDIKNMVKNLNESSINNFNKSKIMKRFYKYTNNGWYVDFANTNLGGGVYGGKAFVQEEKMFYLFPELMIIGKDARDNGYSYIDNQSIDYKERNGAIIITNVLKSLISGGTDTMDRFYSNINDNKCIEKETVKDECAKNITEIIKVNIIAIDAVNYTNSKKFKLNDYDVDILITYIKKAYNGFLFAKKYDLERNIQETIIETGAWGAGVFGNLLMVMLSVQLIAGILADVTIHFCVKSDIKINNIKLHAVKLLEKIKTSL